MTPQLHFETFEEFVEDSRRYYYEDDWTPKRTRAINDSGGCDYRSADGRCCAVGRLAPDADWNRNAMVDHERNSIIAKGAIANIVSKKPNGDVMPMLRYLQYMHDEDDVPQLHYQDALTLARELDKEPA